MRRYMIQVIGSSNGIGDDLNHIADERGVYYVDGKGLFLGTFFSHYSTEEIHEMLASKPAFLIFDITDPETNGINLPEKYYTSLFPETKGAEDMFNDIVVETKTKTETKVDDGVEEYYDKNDILDKLSRNNYDRTCLTEREVEILTNSV
jgi:hypothetical protein